MSVSDNTAADVLPRRLGGPDLLALLAAELGRHRTRVVGVSSRCTGTTSKPRCATRRRSPPPTPAKLDPFVAAIRQAAPRARVLLPEYDTPYTF
jgi:hypothetical protein